MKITILGSGGGEGFPAAFCSCDHCNMVRRAGGKSLRTLSQTLINDDLMIDLPPDSAWHSVRFGVNFGDIADFLITHTHSDHFDTYLLRHHGMWYAHNMKYPNINVYGSSDVRFVFDKVAEAYGGVNSAIAESVHIKEISAYETRAVGKYSVTALPAKHAPKLVALNYVIKENGKVLVYFHDTGFPEQEILDFIKKNFGRVDCVMMDATMGTANTPDTANHMCFDQDKRLAVLLCEMGIADEKTVLVVNHFTHNNAETHDRIEEIFAGTGIIPAYDGMVIEI
ncbi:MAG: hypothetical protein IJY69_05855 [Clostridia bacterium]|nr:hypothetical protein [Clostridia bacterium]